MIASQEHRESLIAIAEKLRPLKQSIPTDSEGNPTEEYLEYLSLMYSPEVAKVATALKPFPKFTEIGYLSKRTGISRKELKTLLSEPSKKLYLVNMGPVYALPTPLFVFDGPFILKSSYASENGKKFAELGKKNFEAGYWKVWETHSDGTPEMRVLAVDVEVKNNSVVLPSDEIMKIIKQSKSFAVVPCACRNREETLGTRKCKDKYPIHTCLLLGFYGKLLGTKFADSEIKIISREEAIAHVKKSAELGLVLTSENVENKSKIICSCCECCCSFMSGLLNYGNKLAMKKAMYTFNIDEEKCIGCGTCESRCKFNAINLEEKASVDSSLCMGCGLCAVTCPQKAFTKELLASEERFI